MIKERTYTSDELIHRPAIKEAIEKNDLSLINIKGEILKVVKDSDAMRITIVWEDSND